MTNSPEALRREVSTALSISMAVAKTKLLSFFFWVICLMGTVDSTQDVYGNIWAVKVRGSLQTRSNCPSSMVSRMTDMGSHPSQWLIDMHKCPTISPDHCVGRFLSQWRSRKQNF